MFQKCPVCDGNGEVPNQSRLSNNTITCVCPTCNGKRIISSITGQPPVPTTPEVFYRLDLVEGKLVITDLSTMKLLCSADASMCYIDFQGSVTNPKPFHDR